MASNESKPAGGFTVTDRRSFTEEAGPRDEAPAGSPHVAQGTGAAGVNAEAPVAAFPPVDFHTFVLSLGSSALLHLGEIENPNDGASQKDLLLAKHTIDILVMLELKREMPSLRIVLVGATEGWTVAHEIAAANVPVIANALVLEHTIDQ